MENTGVLPSPTQWHDNPYQQDLADRDYLYSADGIGVFPKHFCKLTYLLSKPFVRNFRVAIDIGCRVGEFTAQLQRDFATVYAFDPNLWKNFRFNVDLGKVTHYRCALGDEVGEIAMFGGTHSDATGGESKVVPVLTLDTFDFDAVDYIKIDVEGFEKKVLLGATRTLDRHNPLIVVEQNHVVLDGDAQYSAKHYLESIGYRQVAVDCRGWDFVMAREPGSPAASLVS
jgi:FkbM family methyltransferase